MATKCTVYFSTDPKIRVCICELPSGLKLSEIEFLKTRVGNLSRWLQVEAQKGSRNFRIIGIDGIRPDLFQKHVQSALQHYDLQIEKVRDRNFFDR